MSTGTVGVTAPVKQDFLQKLGGWFKNKFVPVAKVVATDLTVAAQVAEPFVDVAVPGIAALYHTTLQMVIQAEGVAAGATGVGVQKLSSVVSGLEPIAIPYLKSIGVSNPTTSQIEAYVQSVVDGLKVFTALTAPPAAPAPAV